MMMDGVEGSFEHGEKVDGLPGVVNSRSTSTRDWRGSEPGRWTCGSGNLGRNAWIGQGASGGVRRAPKPFNSGRR